MYSGISTPNVRQSNMELLRIVAMFMILVYHTVFYELYEFREESPIFTSMMTLLHIGVPLFILISGYFGIKPSISGVFKLYILLLFYNLSFYLIRILINDISFSTHEFTRLFLPFSLGKRYWFFKIYIILYILSPAVNLLRCSEMGKMGGVKILVLFGLCTFYFGWFACNNSLADGKNVINFIFIYLLGDWLRNNFQITEKNRHNQRKKFVRYYLIIAAFVGTVLYLSPIDYHYVLKGICWRYNSPILIIMSVLFFLIFTTFNFKSNTVNWIASSSFAVYLVHENHYFYRDEWYNYIVGQYLIYNPFMFSFVLLGSCFVLFLISILGDKVRALIVCPILLLESKLHKYYFYNKVNSIFNSLLSKEKFLRTSN